MRNSSICKMWVLGTSLVVIFLVFAIGCNETTAPSIHKLNEIQEEGTASSNEPTAGGYIIKPLDTIEVTVWKEPEFSGERLVRKDGLITLPLVGDVQAEKFTTIQLAEEIKGKLKAYIESPEVSVSIVKVQPPKIYIMGEVQKPGEYEIREGMKIVQVIGLAGGFTEWAKKSKIILVRKIKGEEMRFMVNYTDIVSGKDSKQNVMLREGDVLIVQ